MEEKTLTAAAAPVAADMVIETLTTTTTTKISDCLIWQLTVLTSCHLCGWGDGGHLHVVHAAEDEKVEIQMWNFSLLKEEKNEEK